MDVMDSLDEKKANLLVSSTNSSKDAYYGSNNNTECSDYQPSCRREKMVNWQIYTMSVE